MAREPLRRVRVAAAGREALAWAEGLDVHVPVSLLDAGALGPYVDGGVLTLPADTSSLTARFDAAARELRERAAFTPVPPTSSRLPFSYRAVPTNLRMAIARIIGRRQRRRQHEWAAFPGWPLDLSADLFADLAAAAAPRPASTATPVVLTHDLDSPEGLRNLVERFLPLEEAAGARSTSYIVPRAWPLDEGLLQAVVARGHELGIHGFDHANRTPFAPASERRQRLQAASPLIERYAMTGYRAPSLLRTRELLDDVAPLYRYDSSIPTAGGLFPVPNNGNATARPYRIGSLVELPLSLPRDGSLQFLGYTPEQSADLWMQCADRIARARGVAVLLTHCEDHFSGGPRALAAYRSFLDRISADRRFAWARAADVAAPLAHA